MAAATANATQREKKPGCLRKYVMKFLGPIVSRRRGIGSHSDRLRETPMQDFDPA
jgi:hypothetical protein